jgi:hypothetical protein
MLHGGKGTLSTAPESVGNRVNSDLRVFCPFVTPDESYLFFLRVSGEVNDVCWTEARIIDPLRPIGLLGK